MKTVVLYTKKHAESIASAAVVRAYDKGAILVPSDAPAEEVADALKGANNVYILVDGVDARHLKGDTTHYQKPESKGPRRVVSLYQQLFPGQNLPKILYHVGGHLNHDEGRDEINAGIVGILSDLNDDKVSIIWNNLLVNKREAISTLTQVGEGILNHCSVKDSDEPMLKGALKVVKAPAKKPAAKKPAAKKPAAKKSGLESKTTVELRDLAKKKKVPGYWKMGKKALIKAIS